jgi:hypothetical protein
LDRAPSVLTGVFDGTSRPKREVDNRPKQIGQYTATEVSPLV